MGNSKLDALLWEQIPFDNLLIPGASVIVKENMDFIPFEDIDELCLSRDESYNIKITCIRRLNKTTSERRLIAKADNQTKAGQIVPAGKIIIELFKDYLIELSPCYYNGYKSSMEKVEYDIICYHIESKTNKNPVVLKEWILNGSRSGLAICGSKTFEYSVDGTTYGKYGDFEFPVKEAIPEREYYGRFTHIEYKDTAFDIHFVGDSYGPKWSKNFSISYFEKYGRIPDLNEREMIRDYLSFFMGKQLLYIGNSTYDEMGNQIGFIMENPLTYSFDIERICCNAEKPPINCDYNELQTYFDTLQRHIESFSDIYDKLDFKNLFFNYWHARNIAKPMDLPILSSALEHLKSQWYKKVEMNPDTVLMDKKDFAKRIKPVKQLMAEQFAGTGLEDRMKRSLDGMNRMSVNEQLNHFFDKIGVTLGTHENEAMKARNLPAHGSLQNAENDPHSLFVTSQLYEVIMNRIILALLGYKGKYIDYGSVGYPQKDINEPGGGDNT